MTLSFLLTSLIVVASPGTGVLYTLAVALARGSRASIAAAFGCTLGIVPHMTAAMLGLAAVLHTSALAFAALKWCGVLYLLYMAWQALRESGALAVEARPERETRSRSHRRVIVTGFLINILNPKLSIFFLAFLPQFIASAGADAGIERRLHGDDVCSLRALRPVRSRRPRPRHHPAEGVGLAAPQLCGRLCGAGSEARVRGAVVLPHGEEARFRRLEPCGPSVASSFETRRRRRSSGRGSLILRVAQNQKGGPEPAIF
jgi:threonine/homoserine/homoserine lactone efflux protein